MAKYVVRYELSGSVDVEIFATSSEEALTSQVILTIPREMLSLEGTGKGAGWKWTPKIVSDEVTDPSTKRKVLDERPSREWRDGVRFTRNSDYTAPDKRYRQYWESTREEWIKG